VKLQRTRLGMMYCVDAMNNPDPAYRSYACTLEGNDLFQAWQAQFGFSTLAGAGIAIALSVAEIMTSTAIGVASALLVRRFPFSLLSGLGVRFFPVVLFTLWPVYWDFPFLEIWSWRWCDFTWFALADGGTTPLSGLSRCPTTH